MTRVGKEMGRKYIDFSKWEGNGREIGAFSPPFKREFPLISAAMSGLQSPQPQAALVGEKKKRTRLDFGLQCCRDCRHLNTPGCVVRLRKAAAVRQWSSRGTGAVGGATQDRLRIQLGKS